MCVTNQGSGGKDYTRFTMDGLMNNKVTKKDIEQFNAEKKEAKERRAESKLKVKQQKAETKKLKKAEKEIKAQQKREIKQAKAEQKRLAASVKAQTKAQNKLALTMAKAAKKAGLLGTMVDKNLAVGKNVQITIARSTNPINVLEKAKDLAQHLNDDTITPRILKSSDPDNPWTPEERKTHDDLKYLQRNCEAAYTQLLGQDKTTADNFLADMVNIMDKVDRCTAEQLRQDMEGITPKPNSSATDQIETFKGSFLREDNISTQAIGKLKASMDGVIKPKVEGNLNLIKGDASLKPLFHAGLAKIDGGKISISALSGSKLNGKEVKDVLTPQLKEKAVKAHKDMVNSLLDPGNVDAATKRLLGDRYHRVYNSVFEGLKNSGLSESERKSQAEGIAYSSVVNELGLRILAPRLVNAGGDMAMASTAMCQALQTQINVLSNNPNITSDDYGALENRITSRAKNVLIDHMVTGSLGTVHQKMQELVKSCLDSSTIK